MIVSFSLSSVKTYILMVFFHIFLQKKGASRNLFTKKATQTTKWDCIISAVKARQYGRALRGLYAATKGTKRQFRRIVVDVVRKEVSALLRQKTFPLFQDVNVPSLEQFSWTKTLTEFEKACPMLYNVLRGAITCRTNEQNLIRGKGVDLKPQLGTTIAYVLHAKAPKTASFLPTLFSVQFWRGSLKRNVLKQLAHIGVCKGYDTTLNTLDRIRQGFDSAAVKCKEITEEQLQHFHEERNEARNEEGGLPFAVAAVVPNIEEEINEPSTSSHDTMILNMDDTIPYEMDDTDEEDLPDSYHSHEGVTLSSGQEDDSSDETGQDLTDSENGEEILEDLPIDNHTGFSMCWDNVGKKVTSRHPSEHSKNRYLNMALGYIAVNRIPTTQLNWQFNDDLRKAAELPSSIYVPNTTDFEMLSNRMKVVVSRIISRHLTWFNANFSDCVTSHILHEYSGEATKRSVLINLGVFDVDPSSTQGAIEIYENLQRYIPSVDNTPYTALVYGDGLSCERGNDAHKGRVNGLNPWERLEGCEPAVQEFHKEMLLLQDYFDEFFKGSSAADRGTLCHLKNLFNFRQVKSDISDNFNHARELMCVVTEGYVCLLAMKLMEMNDKSDRPETATESIENSDIEDRREFLQSVVTSVVETVWYHLETESLKTDDETEPEVFCCGEDIEEDVILCGAGRNCTGGEVFHYSCVGLDADDLPNTWFCSEECRNEKDSYPYCICHQDLGNDETVIGCSAGSKCTAEEWYHLKCLNKTEVPEGDWYCKAACKRSKKSKKRKKSK